MARHPALQEHSLGDCLHDTLRPCLVTEQQVGRLLEVDQTRELDPPEEEQGGVVVDQGLPGQQEQGGDTPLQVPAVILEGPGGNQEEMGGSVQVAQEQGLRHLTNREPDLPDSKAGQGPGQGKQVHVVPASHTVT